MLKSPLRLRSSICNACKASSRWSSANHVRLLSSTSRCSAEQPTQGKPESGFGLVNQSIFGADWKKLLNITAETDQNAPPAERAIDGVHHLHIYATKHNTHLTFTHPNKNPIISLSAGNLGFRKANRGTYDSAYQLTAYVLGRIHEEGWMPKIKKLQLIFRGFGVGREAVTKAILGTEGRHIRRKITKLSDSTRLKQGGTRSPKPRRLG